MQQPPYPSLLPLLPRRIALIARRLQLRFGGAHLLRRRCDFRCLQLVRLGLGYRGLARGALFGGGGFAGEAGGFALGDQGIIGHGLGGEPGERLGAGLLGERGAFLEAGVFVGCHGRFWSLLVDWAQAV